MIPVLAECYEEDGKKVSDVVMPDSMEIVKEGDVNVMVPKGGQVRKESSFLIKEDADEYASRRFSEMEIYLREIKNEIEAQKKELNNLKEAVENIKQEKDKNKSQK